MEKKLCNKTSSWNFFSSVLSFGAVLGSILRLGGSIFFWFVFLVGLNSLPGFFREDPAVPAISQAVQKDDDDKDDEVSKRVNTLADLFIRVRKYEKQLHLRASALDTLLKDTKALDYGFEGSHGLEKKPAALSVRDEGYGGGDESLSPIVHASGRKNFFPDNTTKLKTSATIASPEKNTTKIKSNLLKTLDSQIAFLDSIPLGAPVDGIVSSPFGLRRSPFSERIHRHEGIDILIDHQSSILSTADGTVVEAGYKGSYGRAVVIDHGNGIETIYGHLSKSLVEIGQQVCRGEQLGLVGSTGRSTGPHLHYEVRVSGIARDPTVFVELASLLRVLGK